MNNICLVQWLKDGAPVTYVDLDAFPHESEHHGFKMNFEEVPAKYDSFICKHCGLVYSIKEDE